MLKDNLELLYTGERMVTNCAPQSAGATEHLHRYALAGEYTQGKAVLDIACGEGYGSSLLAGKAASVVGVDIDETVVEHARKKYGRENLTFQHGNCTAIPLADQAVEVVVSFETIEHFVEHEAFIAEIKRVLTPGGLLVLSTPNRPEFSEKAKIKWQFHEKELNEAEFMALLQPRFRFVQLMPQRLIHGSCMIPSQTEKFEAQGIYTGDFNNIDFVAGSFPARFYVALCSDNPLPNLRATLFEGRAPAATQAPNNQPGRGRRHIFSRAFNVGLRLLPGRLRTSLAAECALASQQPHIAKAVIRKLKR